jgi:ABC-type multidrug transport system fused ATPase/permease subunit
MFNRKKKKKDSEEESFSLGLKRFVIESKNEKKNIFIMSILIIFSFIFATVTPLFAGKIIDALISESTMSFMNYTLNTAFFFIFILALFKFIERNCDVFLFYYYIPKVANLAYRRYSKSIFSKIISYPTSFFKTESLGKIVYSSNTGAATLSRSFLNVVEIIGIPVMFLLNTFFLFFVS